MCGRGSNRYLGNFPLLVCSAVLSLAVRHLPQSQVGRYHSLGARGPGSMVMEANRSDLLPRLRMNCPISSHNTSDVFPTWVQCRSQLPPARSSSQREELRSSSRKGALVVQLFRLSSPWYGRSLNTAWEIHALLSPVEYPSTQSHGIPNQR